MISTAMRKYVIRDTMSVREAISGPAIRAGSRPILFAIIGSNPPMHFAATTITTMDTQTVMATRGGL